MDVVERIIQRAIRKAKDGRIDASDFLNEAASSMRYGIFTPLEVNIIWHFASRGAATSANQRLTLADFEALLDAKWQPPQAVAQPEQTTSTSFLSDLAESTYHFIQGGIAGGLGAYVSRVMLWKASLIVRLCTLSTW